MLRPYISMAWDDKGPHMICTKCGARIDLKHRKDWESYSKKEYWEHYDAH